jgi:hypothetical protein
VLKKEGKKAVNVYNSLNFNKAGRLPQCFVPFQAKNTSKLAEEPVNPEPPGQHLPPNRTN